MAPRGGGHHENEEADGAVQRWSAAESNQQWTRLCLQMRVRIMRHLERRRRVVSASKIDVHSSTVRQVLCSHRIRLPADRPAPRRIMGKCIGAVRRLTAEGWTMSTITSAPRPEMILASPTTRPTKKRRPNHGRDPRTVDRLLLRRQ